MDEIDKNLSLNDVLKVLNEGLLPTGSAIMEGDSQLWPEQELDIMFYADGDEEDIEE